MKKTISIIGGGSSAILLACFLDSTKYDITIFERNNTIGRKLLVAGDGGFNLTHSEASSEMIKRYTPSPFFKNIIEEFSNIDLRNWLREIGIETYIGSSKRIFPIKGIKPIQVLNALTQKLKENSVTIKTKHQWMGWDGDNLKFEYSNIVSIVKSDITVLALGGSSWKITGSDGEWIQYLKGKNIFIKNFEASNCAYQIAWSPEFLKLAEGKSLKNIAITCNGMHKKGEVVITQMGLEGVAIYAISPAIRSFISNGNYAPIELDLKPSHSLDEILNILNNSHKKSIKKSLLDDLKLSETAIELLKHELTKEEFISPQILAHKIKKLPLNIIAPAPINEAISTVGGIPLNAISKHFELNELPNTYCIGEMLDWDAPTGGYLLQACFSMGVKLARYLNQK